MENIQRNLLNFDEKKETPLCKIMYDCGSDKSTLIYGDRGGHNYSTFYYSIFNNIKNNKLRIFELGVGSINPNIVSNMAWKLNYKVGTSLYGWKTFFKNSDIYGAQILMKLLLLMKIE